MYMKSNFCSVARRHVGRDRCSQKQLLLAIQERLSVTASRSVKPNLQDRNLKNWNWINLLASVTEFRMFAAMYIRRTTNVQI